MAIQALVMGFGGTGAHVLTSLKELTMLKHGRVPETIKFLLFDTIADWKPGISVQIVGGGAEEKTAESEDTAASLDPLAEYFQLADFQPDLKTHVFEYLSQAGNPDDHKHLKDWLHAPWLSQNIPLAQLGVKIGAAQQRQIGRYAMFKNAEKVVAHLRPIIRKLSDLARGADVNVWLVSSSAGGTGAGCLIDAAYLTRLAAGDSITLKVTGVIVLPNVYMNVRGISQGRAYSLLRELERVQEQGIPQSDRYVDLKRELVSSRVIYDRSGQQTAVVQSRLFDDLFYLGNDCPGDDERREFFTSVASAIDPYLDANSGPTLLERAVNETAAASAFGASRIYVPTETFTEIFAWEQVAEYLRRAAAAKEVGDRVEGLHVGEEPDRADSAKQKFRSLLELFKQLLDLEDKIPRAKETFAREELDARRIVTVWYELTGGNRTPDEQAVTLTYLEPYYSLIEPERPKDPKEFETKTYKENANDSAGVRETQEESRGRFADRLEEIKKRYTNVVGGERTFQKGRLHVLETISKRLKKKVDELFIGELERRRSQFAQTTSAPDQGTPLTQLFAEVTWMLGDEGPVRKVHDIVGQFVAAVGSEEAERNNRYTQAIQELRQSQKGGMFSFGVWVETYQHEAREECSNYISWYQKHELLKNMQQLLLNVEQRLRDWQRLLSQLFDVLVRREAQDDGEASALFNVTQIQLKGTLEKRLNRAARNRSAMISFGEKPDPDMHGYKEELRKQSAGGLASELLNKSHWEAGLTPEEMPSISLVIDLPQAGERRYSTRDIRGLSRELYQVFYRSIDERLGNTDIFDYLIWLEEHSDIKAQAVATFLNNRASSLINAGGVPETRTLVYHAPAGSYKEALADSIALKLAPLDGVEQAYSDRNAITLIKIKKPSLSQIRDIEVCRNDYFALRADSLNDDETHDTELRRAQVFHPFRQELEAWHIERYYRSKESSADVPTLPPRVARLLEDPEMMQIFVHGVATGAVEPGAEGWVWHGPNEDIVLTIKETDPNADVVKAAVIFALRQGEGRPGGLRPITREAARQSVTKRAQAQGKTRDEMLVEFVNTQLDKFLEGNASPQLRAALKMVFTFYCDPKTRTALQLRVDLS